VTERLIVNYDFIYKMPVQEMLDDHLKDYDLVLMVDVIEHLSKEEGLRLIDRIPGWMVICTPQEWFQNPEAGLIPPEKHRSLWSVEDFRKTGRLEHDASQLGGVLVRLAPKKLDEEA